MPDDLVPGHVKQYPWHTVVAVAVWFTVSMIDTVLEKLWNAYHNGREEDTPLYSIHLLNIRGKSCPKRVCNCHVSSNRDTNNESSTGEQENVEQRTFVVIVVNCYHRPGIWVLHKQTCLGRHDHRQ